MVVTQAPGLAELALAIDKSPPTTPTKLPLWAVRYLKIGTEVPSEPTKVQATHCFKS